MGEPLTKGKWRIQCKEATCGVRLCVCHLIVCDCMRVCECECACVYEQDLCTRRCQPSIPLLHSRNSSLDPCSRYNLKTLPVIFVQGHVLSQFHYLQGSVFNLFYSHGTLNGLFWYLDAPNVRGTLEWCIFTPVGNHCSKICFQ